MTHPPDISERWVILGRVTGLYGVRGWVRVASYTDPLTNLLRYAPLYLQQGATRQRVQVAERQTRPPDLLLRFEQVTDRTAAAALLTADVVIPRAQLPSLPAGEYYWADFYGLAVVTTQGVPLGQVSSILETPANAVLVVQGERERLLPLLIGSVITEVDLAQQRLVVDWDPEF